MAIIYEGKTVERTTSKTNTKHRKILLLMILIFIAITIITILNVNELIPFLLFVLSLEVVFLFQLLFKDGHTYHNKIERIGEDGEQKALDIFRELDDNYTIFHNMNIYYKGKTSELDNIMICRHGIFIIEIKNMKGHISGSHYDYELLQEKTSYSGNIYESNFYNPIKQVNTHIYRLSHYLKSRGIYHYINGIVFFVNDDVSLDIDSDDIPVFDIYSTDDLFDYIQSFPLQLSKKEQTKITKILLNSI